MGRYCQWTPSNHWYGHLSDLRCCVDGKLYLLHSAVISSRTSLYVDSGWSSVEALRMLNALQVDSRHFDEVVSYLYNRKCRLTADNCLPVLRVAHALRMRQLYTIATRVYRVGGVGDASAGEEDPLGVRGVARGVTVDNCIEGYLFARRERLFELRDFCARFLLRNAMVTSATADFRRLTGSQLSELLASDLLNVVDEYQTFQLAVRWSEHQHDSIATASLVPLLKCVRSVKPQTFHRIYSHDRVRRNAAARRHLEGEWLKLRARVSYTRADVAAGLVDTLPARLTPLKPRLPARLVVTAGGWHGSLPLCAVECYDCSADRWFPMTFDPPIPIRAYHGMVECDDDMGVAENRGSGTRFLMIGGLDHKDIQLTSVVVVDVASATWKYAAKLNTPRCFPSAARCLGKVYALGGIDRNTRLHSAECYDPHKDVWTPIANMHGRRSDSSSCSVGG